MSDMYFPAVERWCLPAGVFRASLAELERDGQQGNEGVALWLGQHDAGSVDIQHVVVLRGPGVRKCPRVVRIASWLLNDVTDLAIELGVILVGQIHSHGGGWTNLSDTDRADGIAVPHYLSVIAPYYGMRVGTRLADCGVHVFEPPVGWRRLPAPEVARRLEIVAGGEALVHTLGEDVAP